MHDDFKAQITEVNFTYYYLALGFNIIYLIFISFEA